MPTYPVHVPRDGYRGSNPARRRKQSLFNSRAKLLEDYLNAEMEKLPSGEIRMFTYGFIAIDVKMNAEDVRDVLYGVDAGSGGITIRKP